MAPRPVGTPNINRMKVHQLRRGLEHGVGRTCTPGSYSWNAIWFVMSVQGEGQHATVWSDMHDESTFRDELEGA